MLKSWVARGHGLCYARAGHTYLYSNMINYSRSWWEESCNHKPLTLCTISPCKVANLSIPSDYSSSYITHLIPGQMYSRLFCLARYEYTLFYHWLPSYWLLAHCWSESQTVFFFPHMVYLPLPARCPLQIAYHYSFLYCHLQKRQQYFLFSIGPYDIYIVLLYIAYSPALVKAICI